MLQPIIDLRRNYPVLESQRRVINQLFSENPDLLTHPFALAPAEGTLADRQIAADWLSTEAYPIPADRVLVGIGGHQGALVAIIAGGLAGKTIAVEEYTYATFKQLAGMMNFKVVAVKMDEQGVIPASLDEACHGEKISALYFMPTVHNPVGTVMSLERRREIIGLAEKHNLLLIEDDAYGFLDEQQLPNFAQLAPDRTFYIHSFSKPFAPGLKVAFFVTPPLFTDRTAAAISATSSNSVPLMNDLCSTLLTSGAMQAAIDEKRLEGARCQQIARKILHTLEIQAHPNSWHLWAVLPAGIAAEEFAARVLRAGVDINAASNFYAPGTRGIEAIRIGLGGAASEEEMIRGLEVVRDVLASY